MSILTDSNRRPTAYKAAVLPTELKMLIMRNIQFNCFQVQSEYLNRFGGLKSTPKHSGYLSLNARNMSNNNGVFSHNTNKAICQILNS